MKPKTDETPDEWVRQMLDRLPDAPPPGSAFDSARLWSQLQPELERKPVRRRIGWAAWLSAACLAGLVVGWLAWQPTNRESVPVVAHRTKTERPSNPLAGLETVEESSRAAPIAAETHHEKFRPNAARQQHLPQPSPVKAAPTAAEPEPLAQSPDVSIAFTKPVAVEKAPELRKANKVTITSKRRFRVMHENELRAEDEAAPKIYRADHFVRLGTGARKEGQSGDEQRNVSAPDSRQPTLTLPLTNNSNQ